MDTSSAARLVAAKTVAEEAVADYARAMVDHHAPERGYEGTYSITITLREGKIVGRHISIGG
jgi:hypothetical protein